MEVPNVCGQHSGHLHVGGGEGEEVVFLCYKVPLTCCRLNSSTIKTLPQLT